MTKTRFYRPKSGEASVRIRPGFDDFHVLRMRGSYEYPRHRHASYEAVLVDRGPYQCELNGSELRLQRGEVLLVKPGDWHQDHLRNGQRHYVVHFHLAGSDPSGLPLPLFAPGVPPESQVVRGNHLEDAKLVRELRRESVRKVAYGGAIQDCLLEAFFWRLVRSLDPGCLSAALRRLPHSERTRERLMRFAQECSGQRMPVARFAQAMRRSVRGLSAVCRSALGRSPARLLLETRIQRAEDLLNFGGYSIKEVSDRLGFANPFHFSRAFKRVRGFPPSALSAARNPPGRRRARAA